MYFLPLLSTVLTATLVNSYEECEGNFCPPSSIKPRLLSFGNNIAPLIGKDPLTGCYCREEIDHFTLCYGRNQCTSMTKNLPLMSNTLKLTNTHIKTLGPGDFQKLDHMVEMQIEGNYDLSRILNGTFENLHNLVNLSIAFNKKLWVIEGGAFLGLTNLQNLFLNNNAFDNLYDITIGLSPQVVPKLTTLILDSNNFLHINGQDFKLMLNSTLKDLSMNLCRIEYIDPEAFTPLKNLQKLHLGENTINSSILTNMLQKMVAVEVNLKTLNFFYMGFKKNPPSDMMKIIASSNISQLNLSKNQFEVINRESFPLMPSISLLDLRDVLAIQITDDAFANLPNLSTLLISGNRFSQVPQAVLSLQKLTFLDMQANAPGESYHVYFSFKEVEFTNMTNLMYLNLAYNGIAHLFNTSFKGLKNLRVLILKNASVFHIEKRTFVFLKELRVLNLANNIMVHEEAVPDVFFTLTKLEKLILTGCKYKYITRKTNPFRNLISLKYLGMEKNSLKTIGHLDLLPLTSLIHIDLSFNLLTSWEERVFTENKNLSKLVLAKNKLTDLTIAMIYDFANIRSVDLDQNSILCKCSMTYKSYKNWYLSTNNDVFINSSIFEPPVYCGYPEQLANVTIVEFLTKQEYGEHICSYRPDRIFLLLPLICTVIFFLSLGGLAFWYRWHIKYWVFLSKLYLSRKGKIKPSQTKKCYTNYEYDAFVSYSNEDRDFVIKLVEMMENYEPCLKLCVYERDFQIGTIISESVLESVAKSRKTVLIISDHYAKSQWCRWESQICEHHRLFFENEDGEYVDDSLVLVKLSPVSESNLTPTLKYLLKTRIYLQWGWDDLKQDVFWNKLRTTLGPPVSLNLITHM